MTKYAEWISATYPTKESAHNQCAEATMLMVDAFPELTRVRGHVWCSVDSNRPHWWCVTPDGSVVDPTRHQWDWLGEYTPWDESKPEPTGICPNCGGYCYDGKYLCCKRCEVSYAAYCSGGSL
jgi:hypothetical protein